MKRTVFYTWQSEHPHIPLGRNFIQASLEAALKKLGKDNNAEIKPVLDRDTGGVPGSPSITDKIFEKIVLADVFVAFHHYGPVLRAYDGPFFWRW